MIVKWKLAQVAVRKCSRAWPSLHVSGRALDRTQNALFSREYSPLGSFMYVYTSLRSSEQLKWIRQLGNYLGAISNWVKLQNEAPPEDDIIISIVGWHALTLPQNPRDLAVSRTNMLATLLAFGINPNRVVLFHQEDVGTYSFCPPPLGPLSFIIFMHLP